MGIGTSMGAYYEDSFHAAAAEWDPKYDNNEIDPSVTTGQFGLGFDNNVVTPGQVITNKQLDQVEQTELGGIQVKDVMPFPDNKNPDSTFDSRFGTLPPSGILNDLKKPVERPVTRKL